MTKKKSKEFSSNKQVMLHLVIAMKVKLHKKNLISTNCDTK